MTHYETLGVEKGADQMSIKRAYKRKASKAHPDKGGDKAQFQQLQKAYATLSDPSRREHYDRTGEERSGDNIEQEAMSNLAQGFQQYLDNAQEHINPLAFIRGGLAEGRRQAHEDLSQTRQKLKTFERKSKAAKRKKPGHDLFAQLVADGIRSMNARIAAVEHALVVITRTEELLNEYESGVIEPAPVDPWRSMGIHVGSGSNTSFWGQR